MNIFEDGIPYHNLLKSLKENSLCHSYLFLSSDEVNNSLFVDNVVNLLLCDDKKNCGACPSCLKIKAGSHPDVLRYPKNKSFVVDDANDISSHAYEKPMLADRKIIVINNIDEATVQAQNKILKILEEPPRSVIFLLTAKNENKILTTVISRTRKINLMPLSKYIIKDYINLSKRYNEAVLNEALEYGEGWIGKTLKILENENFLSEKKLANEITDYFKSSKDLSNYSSQILKYKDDIRTFLELLSKAFERAIIKFDDTKKIGIIEIIKEIDLSNQNLLRNVSVNLIIDNLLMKILELKYIYKI